MLATPPDTNIAKNTLMNAQQFRIEDSPYLYLFRGHAPTRTITNKTVSILHWRGTINVLIFHHISIIRYKGPRENNKCVSPENEHQHHKRFKNRNSCLHNKPVTSDAKLIDIIWRDDVHAVIKVWVAGFDKGKIWILSLYACLKSLYRSFIARRVKVAYSCLLRYNRYRKNNHGHR